MYRPLSRTKPMHRQMPTRHLRNVSPGEQQSCSICLTFDEQLQQSGGLRVGGPSTSAPCARRLRAMRIFQYWLPSTVP